MNNQVLFVSVLLLSVSVAILFYQNVKLSRKLDREMGSVNKNMTDMSRMIALNNNINLEGAGHPEMMTDKPIGDILPGGDINVNDGVSNINLEPTVTEDFKQEINQLKTDYQDYELSNELKNEIDNLEQLEALPESLELSRENLEELQNAQMTIDSTDDVSQDAVISDLNEVDRELEVEPEEFQDDNIESNIDLELENDTELDNLVEANLDNQIVDWNDDIREVSLDGNLNPPESISLDSGDIKAEVTQGVNELVGNIIASASDVEVVNDDKVIKLTNEDDNVIVNINNEKRTLEDLNGNELKEVCKYFNLKAKGKKIELVERIKDYQINLKNSKNFFVLEN